MPIPAGSDLFLQLIGAFFIAIHFHLMQKSSRAMETNPTINKAYKKQFYSFPIVFDAGKANYGFLKAFSIRRKFNHN